MPARSARDRLGEPINVRFTRVSVPQVRRCSFHPCGLKACLISGGPLSALAREGVRVSRFYPDLLRASWDTQAQQLVIRVLDVKVTACAHPTPTLIA